MSDDGSESFHEQRMSRFVRAGMRLTYEFESLGEISTALGHRIVFFPVISSRTWSTRKEYNAALRFVHFADRYREIGRCLVDHDEVSAWGELFRTCLQEGECGKSEFRCLRGEYVTRHGVRLVWGAGESYRLYVASPQPAHLPCSFITRLLQIFSQFEVFCQQFD